MELWEIYRKDEWPENVKFKVSSLGRVINLKSGKKKSLTKINKYGLKGFAVYIGKNKWTKGKTTTVILHRAMATCFIPNPENKPFVIHKDHNVENNVLSNLAWVSKEEWKLHAVKSPARLKQAKLMKRTCTSRKLTDVQVISLKRKLLDPNRKITIRALAEKYGLSEMQLYRIKKGINWGHIKF